MRAAERVILIPGLQAARRGLPPSRRLTGEFAQGLWRVAAKGLGTGGYPLLLGDPEAEGMRHAESEYPSTGERSTEPRFPHQCN